MIDLVHIAYPRFIMLIEGNQSAQMVLQCKKDVSIVCDIIIGDSCIANACSLILQLGLH